MKTILILLGVAVLATFVNAKPEPIAEADALAEAFARAFADPGTAPWTKAKEIFKTIYAKVCVDEEQDRCKEWVKEKFTWENIKKYGAKFAPEIKEYCEANRDSTMVKIGCKLYNEIFV